MYCVELDVNGTCDLYKNTSYYYDNQNDGMNVNG